MPDDTVLKEGDTVLFDVGCKFHGYCSDMTRTFFYRKEPTEAQKNIYNLVRQANEEAEEMVRPGVRLCDIDRKARDIITAGGYGPDFTHRLGHFIGIEDHDFGDVSQANNNLTQAGNIFSIEPGIYNASAAGVRIEDLVLITEEGHEVLNKYPKDLQIIE
jgi:Xaa-Pro dipeptidase